MYNVEICLYLRLLTFKIILIMALKKSRDKVIAGVCGGIAEALGFDKTLMRVIWAFLILFAGCGLLLYIILWLLMPNK